MKVKVNVPVPVVQTVDLIGLSIEEATAIMAVLGRLAGPVEGTVRAYTDGVWEKLKDGLAQYGVSYDGPMVRSVGTLKVSAIEKAP